MREGVFSLEQLRDPTGRHLKGGAKPFELLRGKMDEATSSSIAPRKEKIHSSHSIWMVGLLLLVWLVAPGTSRGEYGCCSDQEMFKHQTYGLDNNIPQNLLCYKPCCGSSNQCLVNCSWEAGRNADANYTLRFWYHNKEMNRKSQTLEAGNATFLTFKQDLTYAWQIVTIWVESHVVGSPLLVSKNLTLQISEAFKFNPPSRNSISIYRMNNILTLRWPKPDNCNHPNMKKEARIKPRNNVEWTLRNCTSDDRAEKKLEVTCHLGKNIRYEAQVRFRTSDRSSHWSDWSESVSIPAEILESPKVDYTIGHSGNNGLRNVTLEWEKPNIQHEDVHYKLTFRLLPCSCEETDFQISSLNGNQSSYQTTLSSAGYNISLEVSNKAGSSQVRSLQLPPAQDAGTRFLNVSLSGRNFTLKWEAKMDTDVYCFEKQPLGTVLSRAPCDSENFIARKAHCESSGTVEFNICYRLAVHGFNFDMDSWSTYGFTYLFARNTSLEDPIRVNVTNQKPDSAVIWWEPPTALSVCPGKLKKYIICCQHEQDRKISYHEASASETHYTIQNLQPKTRYRVGVWAYTTGSKSICKALVPFLTSPSDPKMTLTLSFLCLFGGFLAIICIFHFGKKRVKKVLCPALPTPADAEALKTFTGTEIVKGQPEQGLLKFLESSNLLEPFTVEVLSAKEEPTSMTTADSPDLMKAVEEPPLLKEVQMGSGNVLPSEYKGQGFLSPLEDDCHGREGFGEFAGISPETGTGCSLLVPDATEAGDSQAFPLPLAPLSFRLLNKLVVIKNGNSSCDLPCSDDVSI